MSSTMDKVLKIYKSLSQTQTLIGAKLLQGGVINSVWSQRNLETNKNVKYLRMHTVDDNLNKGVETLPVGVSNEVLSAISSSEKNRAVLREVSNGKESRKQLLEIWTNNNLSHAVDLNALNVHGDVYTDAEFKSFAWSPDETKLLYIAEKKMPTREPFYKRKSEKPNDDGDSSPPKKGEEYLFRQDWGEQLVGKFNSVVALYDLQRDSVQILEGIPENLCPGQVTWSPDGTYIVGVALDTLPRKFGLIYCINRPGVIFQLDFDGNFVRISEDERTVSTPRFSPDGKYLIWFEKESTGPHNGAISLMRLELPVSAEKKAYVIVDIIEKEIMTTTKEPFYGIFNPGLPERCWAKDNRRIVFSTPQKWIVKTFVIDIESGAITGLPYDAGSQVILDVFNDHLLLSRKNYLQADQFLIAKLPKEEEEASIVYKELTTTPTIELLKDMKYEFLELEQQNTSDEIKKFSGIYFGPKSGPEKQVPLILWPHGGPHSVFFSTFSLEPSVFVCLGFAIIFVNYRGSVGAGQSTVKFLLGRIGDTDVKDCVLAAKECCKKYPWINPDNMSLVGGSHGGFLVHHLSGQYPEMFRAVLSRNPVIDVASMGIISDIPDWSSVEAGSSYTQQGPVDNKMMLKMREMSPIQHAHKIKAPTYFMLGSKDLRVPCSQGLELYYRLKAHGVPVKANMYSDNHTLSSVPNEMDHVINGALWLLEHTS